MIYWLLTTEYPPFFGGGISTYCFHTAKMLTQNGHDVSVFISDRSVKDVVVANHIGLRTIRFNPNRTGSSDYLGHVTNISYEFAHIVRAYVEEEGKPDIIEAQEYQGIAYYLLQFKHMQYDWCKDVPVLITMHSPAFLYLEYNQAPLYKYPNYWIGEMERFCIQAADVVISPSRYLISEVEKRFTYSHSKFFVVPNPFKFDVKKQTADVYTEQNEIVFFGKLSAQKGTFRLLKYFEKLWKNGFSEPLFLIGGQDIYYHPEGKTMGDVVKAAFGNYIAKGLLKMEGQVMPSKISQRLAQAKVVIVPSIVDNLPYVVMEMMSLGLVVLVSKQGGQAEIITDGVDGFVFDHEAVGSFEAQLKRILKLSSEERATISCNAIKTIERNYNLNKIYEQKINALLSLSGSSASPAKLPFIRQRDTSIEILPEPDNDILSVVIPYYNMGRFIEETIASVQSSSLTQLHIVIVNDGSTDAECIAKLLPYRNNPAFTVLDVPNQGLASARNIGAAKAKGKYLAFLDADDMVAPDYYEKALKVLKHYSNVYFVGAWTQYFEGSNKVWPTFSPEAPLILFHNLVNTSALVYKRSAFLAAGKNDESMPFQGLEDYDSVISLLSNGFHGVVLPEVLFYYRVRKDSMIRGVTTVKKQLLYEYLANKHRDFYAAFVNDVVNLTNANGTGIALDNPSLDLQLISRFPFNNRLSREIISVVKRNKHLNKIAYRAYSALIK